MKKLFILFFVLTSSISVLIACTATKQPAAEGGGAKKEAVRTTTSAVQGKEQSAATVTAGDGLFKRYCAVCHRDGGNIVNPLKTLHKDVRESNGIKTAEDIIKIMRNPAPGMTTFDENKIPDKDAQAIAEYIMKTF